MLPVYAAEFGAAKKPPSASLWYRVLRTSFHHVRRPLPKVWGLCSTCQAHIALCHRGFQNLDQKNAAIAIHEVHHVLHKAERADFVTRVAECEQRSQTNLLHYDYTRAISIPSFSPNISALRRMVAINLMVGGLISFGDGKSYLFTHLSGFTKGANIICTILYFTLRSIFTGPGKTNASRVLHLQCDGGSENINKTVFGFLTYLIAIGWVDDVRLNRMPVGHTHSTVDQFFHSTQYQARREELVSVLDAVHLLQGCHGTMPSPATIVIIKAILDFAAWLEPCLVGHLHGHRGPLIWRCRKNVDGALPTWQYKDSSAAAVWLGAEGKEGGNVQVLTRLPAGQPDVIPDEYEPTLDVVRCLQTAKRFAKDVRDVQWLQSMKSGAAAVDVRCRPYIDGDGIGQEAVLYEPTGALAVRCICDPPMDMWTLPAGSARASSPRHAVLPSAVASHSIVSNRRPQYRRPRRKVLAATIDCCKLTPRVN